MQDTGRPVISCVLAPSLDTPAHIELAERLGYRSAWCYDSPAMYADPWMVLAIAAERTAVIGLGPASLVPSLRDHHRARHFPATRKRVTIRSQRHPFGVRLARRRARL